MCYNYSSNRSDMARAGSPEVKSSSPEPFDGPCVELSSNRSSTDYLPVEPTELSSISQTHPRRREWDSCRAATESILQAAGVKWNTIDIHIQEDAFGRRRPLLYIEVEDNSSRSLWRPTTVTICSMLHERKCLGTLSLILSYCFTALEIQ